MGTRGHEFRAREVLQSECRVVLAGIEVSCDERAFVGIELDRELVREVVRPSVLGFLRTVLPVVLVCAKEVEPFLGERELCFALETSADRCFGAFTSLPAATHTPEAAHGPRNSLDQCDSALRSIHDERI